MTRAPFRSSRRQAVRAVAAWTCLLALVAACGGGPTPTARSPAAPAQAAVSAASSTRGGEQAGAASSEDDVAVPVSLRNPSWGSRTALVTIVEFADFECAFCRRAEATMARVRETYGPETVRIVWKNSPLPIHANARPFAEAAAGVFALGGNAAFWKFHDAAFAPHGVVGAEAYERWAREAGVTDIAAYRAGLARRQWAKDVDLDLSEGDALGVFATPTFFIDGRPLAGALPYLVFQGAIDTEVRAAKAKIAAGTAPDRIYAELVRENLDKASAEDDEDEQASKTVYKLPVGKSPSRGSPLALVTLIEFADYQCPYCIKAEPTVRALREEYGDKLRLVFKDAPLPFHARAEPAAQAALEVRAEKGEAAFWEMHDKLLAPDADLGDEGLVRLATTVGARPEAVRSAIAKHAHAKEIEADSDLAEDFEVDGTPHFFINGRRLVGAQPKEKFDAIINEELRHGQEVLAAGTAPDRLYDALVRDGRGASEPAKKSWSVPLPDRDPSQGSATAKVTVHEWSDFQCPFCKRAQPTLQQIMHDYGGRVRVVWHDLPLAMHDHALLAAIAAREAMAQKGVPGFWGMHDRLFAAQAELTRDSLDGHARALGLDMAKWNAALDSGAHQEAIDADRGAADALDINGTPGFLIASAGATSGYYLSGAQPYAKFRRLIDRALSEAK